MSTLYDLFRGIIGDTVSPYTIPDLRILKYLDQGIQKLSEIARYRVVENITITSADIALGYKDLSKEILLLIEDPMPYRGIGWDVSGGKRIRFINSSYVTPGTYEFRYDAVYKKFNGQLQNDAYFDYPTPEADLAVLFWAIALYQQEAGIIDKSGAMKFVKSKSEEGISITYGSLGAVTEALGAPETLKSEAIKMMKNLPNGHQSLFFSVQV